MLHLLRISKIEWLKRRIEQLLRTFLDNSDEKVSPTFMRRRWPRHLLLLTSDRTDYYYLTTGRNRERALLAPANARELLPAYTVIYTRI